MAQSRRKTRVRNASHVCPGALRGGTKPPPCSQGRIEHWPPLHRLRDPFPASSRHTRLTRTETMGLHRNHRRARLSVTTKKKNVQCRRKKNARTCSNHRDFETRNPCGGHRVLPPFTVQEPRQQGGSTPQEEKKTYERQPNSRNMRTCQDHSCLLCLREPQTCGGRSHHRTPVAPRGREVSRALDAPRRLVQVSPPSLQHQRTTSTGQRRFQTAKQRPQKVN